MLTCRECNCKNNSVLVIWNKHTETKQRFSLFTGKHLSQQYSTVMVIVYTACVQSIGFPYKHMNINNILLKRSKVIYMEWNLL